MKSCYLAFLKDLFKKQGTVLLGSEISNELVAHFSIKPDAARQVVRNSVREGVLFSSKPSRFAHGQYGYAVEKNPAIFTKLLSKKDGIGYAYALLQTTAVPPTELIKVAQSIYTDKTDQEALHVLIDRISSIAPEREGVAIKSYLGCRFYGIGSKDEKWSESNLGKALSSLRKDAKICELVYSYFKNMNLISEARYRSQEEPWQLVGDYVGFDMIAYSTLGRQRQKTTFLFDSCIAWGASEERIKRFIRRIKVFYSRQSAGAHKYVSRPIGVVIVRDINHSLCNKVDPKKRLMWIGLRQLFGKSADSLLWVLDQDAREMKRRQLDDSFFSRLSVLAEGDFGNLLAGFLDDIFEIIVNSCLSALVGKPFVGRTITFGYETKEFDGFLEEKDVLWAIEAKNYGRSRIKWSSCDSRGRIKNDCLEYFFLEKIAFLHRAYPGKRIFACYVSKSGYSQKSDSESKITDCELFPGINSYLLTPNDLMDLSKGQKGNKSFVCLEKFYVKDGEA